MYFEGVQMSTCPSPTLQPILGGSWACYHCEYCLLTLLKPILKSKHQLVKLQTNVFFLVILERNYSSGCLKTLFPYVRKL